MRRLPRILLNAATAASLLLCVATATLWAVTRRHACVIRCAGGGSGTVVGGSETVTIYDPYLQPFLVQAERGRLSFRWEPNPVEITEHETRWELAVERPADPLGIWIHPNTRLPDTDRFISVKRDTGRPAVEVSAPFWLVVVLSVILPAGRAIRPLRNRSTGVCRVCGYDLRATPDHCPECGTIPA